MQLVVGMYKEGDIYNIEFIDKTRYSNKFVDESVLLKNQSFTGRLQTGEVVVCSGFVEFWKDVYECWLAVNSVYKSEYTLMMQMLRSLKVGIKVLMDSGAIRVQAMVNINIPNREHFYTYLGFEQEAILSKYYPDGSDAVVYRILGG